MPLDPDFWSLKPVLLNIDSGAVRVRRRLAKMIEEEHSTGQPARTMHGTL
jgi:hypothetical protein